MQQRPARSGGRGKEDVGNGVPHRIEGKEVWEARTSLVPLGWGLCQKIAAPSVPDQVQDSRRDDSWVGMATVCAGDSFLYPGTSFAGPATGETDPLRTGGCVHISRSILTGSLQYFC